jgi:hypothetical protein
MNLALALPHFRIPFHRPVELRVDVDSSQTDRDESLATVYDRIHSPGDRLHGLPVSGLRDPHLRIRTKEADGEFYAYVEHMRHRCLVEWTILTDWLKQFVMQIDIYGLLTRVTGRTTNNA